MNVYNDFLTIFHNWGGGWQFLFLILWACLATAILSKLLDIVNNIVSTLPIVLHGWPKDSSSSVSIEDDTKSSTENK